jgi:DNA primase small subunit
MPHSIPPESTPADESSSREMSQADDIKPEPEPETETETQDATMDDAPSPPAPAEKSKANLEELFDDDSDGEFASSAPVKSEEDASQPAPV